MKTYLDSTVIVSLLCAESIYKAAADAALDEARRQGDVLTCAHSHAETYRTLTTLRKPVPPQKALRLLAGLDHVCATVDVPFPVYRAALAEAARQGLAGSIIYDALHCFAAREAKADKIITRNPTHFELFKGPMEIVALA